MLLPVVFIGLLLFGLPAQGLDLIPSPSEVLSDFAQGAVQGSLSDNADGFKSVDNLWSFLGHDVTPDAKYNSLKFVLFNQADRAKGKEITPDPDSLKKNLNPDVPTKIFVHGYKGNISYTMEPNFIKNAYLNHSDYNLILVDWAALAAPPFVSARSHAVGVADRVAKLLNALAESKISVPKDQHIIGHSLGGQVVGLASRRANTKPGRCTGLDPAGPLFQVASEDGRISASDADLVDVIHKLSSYWGIPKPVGLVDFYPNGGVWPQPGCGVDADGNCSHLLSVRLFAYSISHPDVFKATLCETPAIIKGDCPKSTDRAIMGEKIRFQKPGMYYLQAELPQEYMEL